MTSAVPSGVTGRPADPALAAAFPSRRRRAEAEKWLGWLASQLPDDEPFTWWRIPSLVPAERVLRLRRAMLVAVALVVFCATVGLTINGRDSTWWASTYGVVVCLYGYAELFHLGKLRRKRRQSSAPLASPAPTADRPDLTSVGALRADRRACVVHGLAWTPAGLLLGLLGGGPGVAPWPATVIVVLAHVAAAWLFGAALGRAYPLLKFTEVTLGARWWRGGLVRLLEHAADGGLLRRAGGGYAFRDAALRARLAAGYADGARQRAERLAAADKRAGAIAHLTKAQLKRIGRDVAIAFGIAVTIPSKLPGGEGWSPLSVGASLLLGCVAGAITWQLARWLLPRLAAAVGWGGQRLAYASRRFRLRVTLAAAALGAVLVAAAATDLARLVANVLPTALVAACGGWACVVAQRKTRGRGRWLRLAPDAVAIVAAAAVLVVAFDRRLLTADPAAGLLFPVAVWGAVRLWNAMRRSDRVAPKAAALLVFSLLLGGELVLFLVWLANVLSWSQAEVATVRAVLDWTGSHADLPWWAWTALYAVLLAAGLVFLRWPVTLAKSAKRFDRWQVGQISDVAGQLLTGAHVGLMAIVLVGVAAPVTIQPVLSDRLAVAYTVAYQRELQELGELAAYQAIIAAFAEPATAAAGASTNLASLVRGIHGLSSPGPGDLHATEIELRLADRLAAAQATALALPIEPAPIEPAPAEPAPAGAGTHAAGEPGHGSGLPGAAGPAAQATATAAEQDAEEVTHERVEVVADLAAKLLASALSIPQISGNEIYQVVREYLSALVEESPVTDVFAAWAERVPGTARPPAAEALVDPDPARLEKAAAATLDAELISFGDAAPGTDPGPGDPAWVRAEREVPLVAALDFVNQARFMVDLSGTCVDCRSSLDIFKGRPGEPGEEDPDVHLP